MKSQQQCMSNLRNQSDKQLREEGCPLHRDLAEEWTRNEKMANHQKKRCPSWKQLEKQLWVQEAKTPKLNKAEKRKFNNWKSKQNKAQLKTWEHDKQGANTISELRCVIDDSKFEPHFGGKRDQWMTHHQGVGQGWLECHFDK